MRDVREEKEMIHDKYGFISPQESWTTSGNPLVYSVVWMILSGYDENLSNKLFTLWKRELGVLWRTPENTYGQNSHDEYTALGVLCLMTKSKSIPRQVILSAIFKLGFMQNDFNERGAFWKSQMFRFPQIWIIMFAAATRLRSIPRLLLQAIIKVSRLNVQNASGVQLTFLLCHTVRLLGSDCAMKNLVLTLKRSNLSLSEVMRPYYSFGHPIIEGYAKYEKDFLGT